ncbi:MAG: hypothetical protein KBD51_03885 [Candidatus Levybacteria bacterium]|nr:hypothetical protein [Candidatus Levybacteria bacterium]
MSPELVVQHDHYPSVPDSVPADSWTLPEQAIKELERAVSTGSNATLMTESVGFTGFGTSPMQRVRTIRLGVITGFEAGKVTMNVKSGFKANTVEGTPFKVDVLSGDEIGDAIIPVLSETRFWGEATENDDPVTSTEYISSIDVEGGHPLDFYPPPAQLRFP